MCHILAIDDDPDIRALLRDVLEDEGYRVTTLANGDAALDYLRVSDQPLVVLVDQRMPGLTGTDVVETYLQMGRRTPPREFILLTGSPHDGAPMHHGQLPVVAKPFELDALLAVVAQAATRVEGVPVPQR